MTNRPHWPVLLLALCGALFGDGCATASLDPNATASLNLSHSQAPALARGREVPAVVDHVVDGDTLDVWISGREVRVRTLQIDAPESSTLRFGHADRCGAPAKSYAETLVHPGVRVTLELAGSERHDRYGRLLALVHLGTAQTITWQQRMVRAGWAEVFVFDRNRTWLLETLQADQTYASAHRLGVYARCRGEFHEGD
jgi:endonuclease YncB( thermonuclease family)